MRRRRWHALVASAGVVALTVLNVLLIVNHAADLRWMIPQAVLVVVTLGLMAKAARA